jgi:hypothetical protein
MIFRLRVQCYHQLMKYIAVSAGDKYDAVNPERDDYGFLNSYIMCIHGSASVIYLCGLTSLPTQISGWDCLVSSPESVWH